jgi:phosphoglycolate phosphatase
MTGRTLSGSLASGSGDGAGFVSAASDALTDHVGFRPFAGTLNLTCVEGVEELDSVTFEEFGGDRCDGAVLTPIRVGGVHGAVIRPLVPGYPDEKCELLAPVRLRTLYDLAEGDVVSLDPPNVVGPPLESNGSDDDAPEGPIRPTALASELDMFEGVVFDLDGTLLDLAVDWDEAFTAVEEMLSGPKGVLDRDATAYEPNELFSLARDHGVYNDLLALLDDHERAGADDATARPLLEVLPDLDCPVGVCTANGTTPAVAVLDRFDRHSTVDALVGRDTLPEQKPLPDPLLQCLSDLGVEPGDALFVGDGEYDARAALAAETSFLPPCRITVPDRTA